MKWLVTPYNVFKLLEYFMKIDVLWKVKNDGWYRQSITDFLWPELMKMDLEDIWFQLNGATPNFSHVALDSLRQKFSERIISPR